MKLSQQRCWPCERIEARPGLIQTLKAEIFRLQEKERYFVSALAEILGLERVPESAQSSRLTLAGALMDEETVIVSDPETARRVSVLAEAKVTVAPALVGRAQVGSFLTVSISRQAIDSRELAYIRRDLEGLEEHALKRAEHGSDDAALAALAAASPTGELCCECRSPAEFRWNEALCLVCLLLKAERSSISSEDALESGRAIRLALRELVSA